MSTSMPNVHYQHLRQQLQCANIELVITRKRVKNINFRIKPNQLSVSAPHHISDNCLIKSIQQRIDWAIEQHAKILKRQQTQPTQSSTQNDKSNKPIQLWGKAQPSVMADTMTEAERIEWYRRELKSIMPGLFAKWQPIVGKIANETLIKKMTTRWGSCNTKAKRVWLSVYLPHYPIECTEYVIVHELCHLHHANHSAKFWGEVERAMPDYKRWHDMLAGRTGSVD